MFRQHFPRNTEVANEVVQAKSVQQVMGFAASKPPVISASCCSSLTFSGLLAMYCPKLFAHMQKTMNDLFVHYQDAFSRVLPAVYPAATINLGPQVITTEHYDSANLAVGWIAITSLGDFDYKKGGHLILRNLGVVVEFPPGCTVLFPSAVVQHGNVPIQEGETRMSITQYASGSLFRWVDYGFCDEETFFRREPERAAEMWANRKQAWRESLSLYSKVDELYDDLISTFYPKEKPSASSL